jgi:eukaryotic-like serine/threonine-protein kinase
MTWLSDAVLTHLCQVAGWPDVGGTRYELIEKIGEGGMGTVYLAQDRQLERPIALKVLKELPESAQAASRLRREARIIALLEHPCIVPVHDSGLLADGRFYYAMKLVRGKRLDEQIERSTPLAERLQLFQKICDGVGFAHAHGILHRDLKPQNIMLGSFGEVLVMDWGVAKEKGDVRANPTSNGSMPGTGAPPDTREGTVLGTPGYMAPEQARGELDQIDERTDVYALGGLLYFLLCGRAPTEASPGTGSQERGIWAIVPPRKIDRSIPRPLQAICLKALAPTPAERYAGVGELAADIAHLLAGMRVAAYPEGLLGAAWRLATRYRTVLALLLAYLIMRILLLIFARS